MKIKNLILTLAALIIGLVSCVPSNTSEKKEQHSTIKIPETVESSNSIQYFGEAHTFEFYGKEITVCVEENIGYLDFSYNEDDDTTLPQTIVGLRANKIDQTFDQLIAQSRQLGLDDFGYKLLLKKFTNLFSNFSTNFRETIMWYGLRKNALDAKLYTDGKELVCSYRTDEELTRLTYLPEEEGRYYIETENSSGNYGSIDLNSRFFSSTPARPLNFSYKLPILGEQISTEERSFVFGDYRYTLPISYNEYVTEYLDDLPQKQLGKYLVEFELSPAAAKSFEQVIPEWLKDKDQFDQLSFLLKLVEQGFPYRKDRVEKYNFVEQSMRDGYTDCEDRAVLFHYLVTKFMNADALLLLGPRHMCSAVWVNEESSFGKDATTFEYNGKSYLVCDPSCIGGKPGDMAFSKNVFFSKVEVL